MLANPRLFLLFVLVDLIIAVSLDVFAKALPVHSVMTFHLHG